MTKKIHIIFLLFIFYTKAFSVHDTLKVSISITNQVCNKGAAGIQITKGKLPFTITWSTGATNVYSIHDLEAGDYSVNVKDSASKDTTITFKVEKQNCPVVVSNQFTPNGDNYNDTWQIGNINYYPEFELFVFNKWGQEVHHQKGTYTPWNGEWLGVTAADGTYYYVFYFKGSDRSNFLKGDVTILR